MVLKRDDSVGRSLINFYGNKEKVSKHSRFSEFSADTPRGYAVEITIIVSDIDKLWNEVREKLEPKHISQTLKLKRWGKKDFRVIDPFGFYIRFIELVDWGQ